MKSLHILLLKWALLFAVFVAIQPASAQTGSPQQNPAPNESSQSDETPVPLSSAAVDTAPSGSALLLSPGDEMEITVYGVPDLSEHTRVSSGGSISMPLVGAIRVAGLSSSEAEGVIENKLRVNNILNDPQVSVYVKEYTRGGISVSGEVARQGFYSALGPHSLFDIVQLAGGLTEKASGVITVSHRDDEKDTVQIDISQDPFLQNPTKIANSNIELRAGDTVFVAKAAMIYVLGEVNKPGGYILNSSGAVSVLQAVAAAGGPTSSARPGGARMLRRTPGGLQELPIPLKSILRGKHSDMTVLPEDILFVPSSRMKAVVSTSTLVGVSAATAAVYHIY